MTDLDSIARILRVALDLPADYSITNESSFERVPGWDSFGHMRIVLELEKLIGAPLELEEIVGLDTVAKIRALVKAKIG